MFRLGGRWMGRVAASGGLREAMAATTGRRMLLCGPRWTRYASTTSTNTKDEGVVYEFDPVASLRHDAAVETAKRSIGAVLEEILPPGAPDSAVAKVRAYLEQYPMDELITSAQVQITHIQNAESGAEDRVSLSPCTLDEALEQAKLRGLNVVQMGSREDMAYCRLREERPRILATVAEELQSASTEGSGAAPHQPAKKSIDHVFRDAVDAHFVGWRSKKICVDLQRGHPVKLTIKDFQSAESAMLKLREMAQAIHAHATEMGVAHHYTSLNGSDREASLSLVPSGPPGSRPKQAAQGNKQNNNNNTPAVNVRHPGEKEWAHALRKMQSSCKSAGRLGTYMKSGAMKPRNVGSTTYRVDKFGRRVG